MEAQQPTSSRTSSGEGQESSETVSRINNLHEEAFLYVEQGLSCDEQGHRDQAITLYLKGVDCIDHALSLTESLRPNERSSIEKLIEKMTKARAQIKGQIDYILSTDSQTVRALEDPPPTYEVATSPVESMEIVYPDSLTSDNVGDAALSGVSATELFSIQDGVQIFFITAQGNVSAPSYPSGLGIFSLDEQAQGATNVEMPPAFLKVGQWTYPLIPGTSPVLRADWGAYIFPDVTSDAQGASVGVIIPDTITREERQLLEEIFANLTDFRHQEKLEREQGEREQEGDWILPDQPQEQPERAEEQPERPQEEQVAVPSDRTSVKISKGIITGAEWIAWGLQKGAEKTGKLLQLGSAKLREQLTPEIESVKVDPRYTTGVQYARQAAGAACTVSAFLVNAIGKGTAALGKKMAPHVRKHGEKLLPQSIKKKDGGGRSTLDDIIEVSVGGLQGFGTVYMGLEQAGIALAKSLTNETVTVVKHKYGTHAGKATEDTLYTVGGIGMTAYNASHLGVKAIAKRAAKDTAKMTIQDYHEERNLARNSDDVVDKTLPPDEAPLPPKGQPPP